MDGVLWGIALAALALTLRLVIHFGTIPGGVDTWYYLASADALRSTRRLPIRLPQYLLQDETESYPPGFIVFLSLFPSAWLRKYFWVVSPAIDTVQLLLLYSVVLRLIGNLPAAVLGGVVYAVTPQLIAETRNLNPRALGVLLSSGAMLLIFRVLLPAGGQPVRVGIHPWYLALLAVLLVATLFWTHSLTSIAFGVSNVALSAAFRDWHFVGFAVAGFLTALLLSGGFYLRVLENHIHALRFWRRNIDKRGRHQILDSPIYGVAGSEIVKPQRTWTTGFVRPLLRLLGENPFIVAMVLTPLPLLGLEWWGQRMYWWAVSILAWAVLTTFIRPLRVFGPGYLYMKVSVFPTAFSLALVTDGHLFEWSVVNVAILLCILASLAALTFFYHHVRSQKTERTSSLPPDLVAIAEELRPMEDGGVLCLPTMYADFVCYESKKKILWGGHSGDLSKFEVLSPVIRRPLREVIQEYDLRYAVIDRSYTSPEQMCIGDMLTLVVRRGSFELYRTVRPV